MGSNTQTVLHDRNAELASAAAACAGAIGLPPIDHEIEDPELIALLEQLSATLDNATKVLSEAPPLRGPVADEYAAAGVGAAIAASAPLQTSSAGSAGRAGHSAAILAGAILAGLFVCAAAGGYWWFKADPWPSDDAPAMRVTPGAGAQAGPAAGSIRATPGGATTLDLAPPAGMQGQEISIMIQGVPDGVTLSRGSFIGGDTWVLSEQEAADLHLNMPASFPPQAFAIDAVFVTGDGKAPQARKISIVVDAAHAPAPAANGLTAGESGTYPPAAISAHAAEPAPVSGGPADLTKEQESRLLARGRDFIDAGDVASARLIYGHAAQYGSKAGMLALGQTYDPAYLASLGVRGVQPDQSQADAWHERASRQADR